MENSRPNGLLFSGELLETRGIHNSSYWKIAGLTTCYFQWNSWKLGASIIWVISKQWFYWSYTHKYPKNEIKQSVLNILPLGCAQTDTKCSWKVFSGSSGTKNWLLKAFVISRALRALEISKLASRSQFLSPLWTWENFPLTVHISFLTA